jgi:hypothetical protein
MRGINYIQQEKKYGSLAPGPGAYNQDKAAIETSLRYSMGAKLESGAFAKSKDQPGAGSYNPVPVYKKDLLTKFGNDRRKGIFDEKKAKFVPAPNVYKQEAQSI